MRRVEELTDGAVSMGPGNALRRGEAHARRRIDRGDRGATRSRARRPTPALLPRDRTRRARARAEVTRTRDVAPERTLAERMMRGRTRVYRVLLWLYPRRFRRDVRRVDDPALHRPRTRPRTTLVPARARRARDHCSLPALGGVHGDDTVHPCDDHRSCSPPSIAVASLAIGATVIGLLVLLLARVGAVRGAADAGTDSLALAPGGTS